MEQETRSKSASWSKKSAFILVTLLGFLLPAAGGWYYWRHAEMLRYRGLDGLFFLLLIFWSFFAIAMPLQLRGQWDELSSWGILRTFFRRGGMILAGLTGVVLLFFLAVFLLTLPAQLDQPALLLPWLLLLAPLIAAAADQISGKAVRGIMNLLRGYRYYAFSIFGLIFIQFATIFPAFFIGPAGVFLQIIGLIDLIARYGFNRTISEFPVLCTWFNFTGPTCRPALLTFHLGHLLLAYLAVKWGEVLFNQATDGFRRRQKQLQAQISRPD